MTANDLVQVNLRSGDETSSWAPPITSIPPFRLGYSLRATSARPQRHMEASSSTSGLPRLAPFRGHSPPRWIFSYSAQQPVEQVAQAAQHFLPTPLPPPQPLRRSGLGSRIDLGANEDEGDWQGSYGPTLRRQGNVKFVKAKLGGLAGDEELAPKIKLEMKQEEAVPKPKGNTVRGLYESIVGLQTTPAASPTPPRRPTPPPADVDLTLSSDGDDSEDDCVIIDPATGLPAPPPPRIKRLRPKKRHIADLLPQDLAAPHVPPVHYAIKPSNIGWRMLARQGWVEGQGLGPVIAEGSDAEGGTTAKRLKVPLQGVEKFDRRGLGTDGKGEGPKKTREEREREMKRQQLLEKERRGKGARGMGLKLDRENRERKEMIAYMNR